MSEKCVTVTASNVTGSSGTTTTAYVAYDRIEMGRPKVKRTLVRPVRVTAKCPAKRCGGELEAASGVTYGLGNPHWRHICKRCGETAWYAESFPRIEYEAVK